MDVWNPINKQRRGWYLDLMAPNEKGPTYAWLDPSRLYCNKEALRDCVEDLVGPFLNDSIDIVAGIDGMGFILGTAVAYRLHKGFLAIRKAGHLCVKTISQNYTDYSGKNKELEVRTDVIKPGIRVLIVDQWIETGGTMNAAIALVENLGGIVAGVATICMEETAAGLSLQKSYKCSVCIPKEVQGEFNSKWLGSFNAFQIQHEPLRNGVGWK
ncbi:adenine phosphoribosyltransferase-like [Petromyzon marinus]|uniref:adenine phosphoribosyltransferase n=1 Tax=Petromyzon marinus TaxID=7757 RepID=A0AAJ7T410_PETMA|nr:adenine phosphoribosyltransferase-like [Petromyzon marinus]XP_032810952.1 adenine phosphoribosyltransferase-like [Petromyzon marinus]